MIFCTLDDKVAYPSTSDKIKVTYENQFIKDSGSYTYDITFPMAIAANRRIFGNVQRIDVKKNLADFETCRLYAGNRLVMSGKGTVTSITPDKVKVQIVGGKSRIKYNSKFENHYIDEIDYPDIVLDSGVDTATLATLGYTAPYSAISFIGGKTLPVKMTTSNIVGQKGVAVFAPVNDETNDILSNRIVVLKGTTIKTNGHKAKGNFRLMYNLAPQPYLLYVLKKVLEYEGYSIKVNDFDKDPWNRLVIVSACKSGKIKDALPHWTVYKFIDELRKLFNASFVFDEVTKKVSVNATNELLTNDTVTYDCEDDFSVENDDDGLNNLATANIEYSFDNAAERNWRECISQSVFRNFETKEYDSESLMYAAIAGMTDKEKRTSIFKVGYDYYVYAYVSKTGFPGDEEMEWQLTPCGFFNPIIRDADSDSSQEICICPAAMYVRKAYTDSDSDKTIWASEPFGGDAMKGKFFWIPSVTNEKETSIEDMQEDEDGDYYSTVQDAMEGSEEDSSTTEDEASMPVAFQPNFVINYNNYAAVAYDKTYDGEDADYRMPCLITDYRLFWNESTGKESLSLEHTPNASSSRFDTASVDAHNVITIKFATDDIPDPSKIYIFHNKRYICQKVEMNVTDDGIDKVKTGYFYEIL